MTIALLLNFDVYETLGNNILIIDERSGGEIEENNRSTCSYIIAERLRSLVSTTVFLESPSEDVIDELSFSNSKIRSSANKLAKHLIRSGEVDVLLRIFGTDGREKGSCGDAIRCVAAHLGIAPKEKINLLTEINTSTPSVKTVERLHPRDSYRAYMGDIVKPGDGVLSKEVMGTKVRDLPIYVLKNNKIKYYEDKKEIKFTGFVVYLGEPYLVIFFGDYQPFEYLDGGDYFPAIDLFSSPHGSKKLIKTLQPRDLLLEIGKYLNSGIEERFPNGINVCFAEVKNSNTMEFSVFERGANQEIPSNGTAATACVAVANYLGLVNSDDFIRVVPRQSLEVQGILCSLDSFETLWGGSFFRVKKKRNDWILDGPVKKLISDAKLSVEV